MLQDEDDDEANMIPDSPAAGGMDNEDEDEPDDLDPMEPAEEAAGGAEEEDGEEEHDSGDEDSGIRVPWRGKRWIVPKKNVKRKHNPNDVAGTICILSSGEELHNMRTNNTRPFWPIVEPVQITVLEGVVGAGANGDAEQTGHIWYASAAVQDSTPRQRKDDAALHCSIPKAVVSVLWTAMLDNEKLSQSSLVKKLRPYDNNSKPLNPQLNGWKEDKSPVQSAEVKPPPKKRAEAADGGGAGGTAAGSASKRQKAADGGMKALGGNKTKGKGADLAAKAKSKIAAAAVAAPAAAATADEDEDVGAGVGAAAEAEECGEVAAPPASTKAPAPAPAPADKGKGKAQSKIAPLFQQTKAAAAKTPPQALTIAPEPDVTARCVVTDDTASTNDIDTPARRLVLKTHDFEGYASTAAYKQPEQTNFVQKWTGQMDRAKKGASYPTHEHRITIPEWAQSYEISVKLSSSLEPDWR